MAFNIYISERLDPSRAIVSSKLSPCSVAMRELVFGETINTNIYIVDGAGDFSTASGAVGSTVKVGIGIPGEDPVWLNTSWTAITNGWNGVLDPNTQDLLDLFDDGTAVDLRFEVQVTNAAGEPRKYCSLPIRILKRVINTASATSSLTLSSDGQVAIDNGSDTVIVSGLALQSAPRRVFTTVRKPAGGLNLFASVVSGSVSTAGFTVNLNGQTDSADYVLDYLLLF